MTDEVLKAQVDAYVDENWENIIEDIRYLVQVESVEDLSAAEAGKPWGPKSFEALRRGLELAERLGLKTTNVDGYLGFGDLPGKSEKYIATIAHTDIVPLGLGWTVDPLDVTRKDGYLLGRGVLDSLGCAFLCRTRQKNRQTSPIHPARNCRQQRGNRYGRCPLLS